MILDFIPSSGAYVLRCPRSAALDIKGLMNASGFDFSTSASTASEAVLMSREIYAAAAYSAYATPRAKERIGHIVAEVEASWAPDMKGNYRVPMDEELAGYQKADLAYALRRKNTLIGDQPGLGKTVVAISFANEIRAKRVLVICPASIRWQWAKMIRRWSMIANPYCVYPITTGKRGVHPTAEWTIVSYDLAWREAIGSELAKGLYDVLILDEAHYLKTTDTNRTRAVFGGGETRAFAALADRCGAVLALTGTPLPNRPRECYALARALHFDSVDWMSEERFRARFNPSAVFERISEDGHVSKFKREEVGRTDELQMRLRGNFMCRHLKKDVLPQLKLPYYDIIRVDETAAIRDALNAESLLHIDPGMFDDDIPILGDVSVVRHMMGIAKAPLVADYVDMLIAGGEQKLVVGAWHHDVLDILQDRFRRYGVLRIDGKTGGQRKQQIVDEFVRNPKIDVLIGNMQSLGLGTDGLQHVTYHTLIAEPSWVPGENEQWVDRFNRIGQQRQVLADFLVAEGSIDEKILSGVLVKRQGTHSALDLRQ